MTLPSFVRLHARGAAIAIALALSIASFAPASAGPCIGCFGVVTVGKSGLGANCTTASIQDAINKAKLPEWADEVWVTNDVLNGEYRVGTINVSDQTVEIIGGFDDCSDVTPDGFTTISGAGGQTNSVFTIRGSANVGLTGLIVTGGDDGPNDDGGGIDFKGNGNLTLQKMRVVGNFAGYGGGILAGGNALNVNVFNDVLIADNAAFHNGGGIHLNGATLNLIGINVGVHRNQALGQPDGGFGGGVYIKVPGKAEISATGYPDGLGGEYPVFADNTAVKGGAIAAMGSEDFTGYANVRISPGVSGGPFVFIRNRAKIEGGALYSGAASIGVPQNNDSAGRFCAYDTAFRENVAPDGAASYFDSASSLTGDDAQGSLSLNGGPGCEGATVRQCTPGSVCNEFSGNRTESLANGSRTGGAVVEFEGSRVGKFESRGSLFKNNVAGSLVHMGDGGEFSLLSLLNCVLLQNDLTRPTIDSDADETVIRHCTIADNTIAAGQFVLRIVESGAGGFGHLASITNSIIAQPLNISLDLRGATNQTIIRNVMSTEIASLKPEEADGTVVIGDAQFVSPAGGDYRPGVRSRAVDVAPPLLPDGSSDGIIVDALRLPRSVDLPPQVDLDTFRDLGAFELQAGTPIPADELFLDSFE